MARLTKSVASSTFGRGLEGFRLRIPIQFQPIGVSAVDVLLAGGIPRGSLVEFCGAPSSGRTSLSLSLLANATRQQETCAYVDVSDSLDPMSLAAAGVDLDRLLWVRCGQVETNSIRLDLDAPDTLSSPQTQRANHLFLENTARRVKQHGTWRHPRDQIRGIETALPSIMRDDKDDKKLSAKAHPGTLTTIPFPSNKPGKLPLFEGRNIAKPFETEHIPSSDWPKRRKNNLPNGKPWKRLDQALRVTDLLLHSAGWAVVVLDLGSISWMDARRIELSTWFRFRRAIENTPTILALLAEESCAKSCASLVLRCERTQANWSYLPSLNSQNKPAGTPTFDGYEVEGRIISSRTGLQVMDAARWTTTVL